MIPFIIKEWQYGWKVVIATKPSSQTSFISHTVRRFYYTLLDRLSDFKHLKNATGFSLYDKEVIDIVREIYDLYPYLRGTITDLGYPVKKIDFNQPRRIRGGISENNFYTLYDLAMLAIAIHSKLPLRLASFLGLG